MDPSPGEGWPGPCGQSPHGPEPGCRGASMLPGQLPRFLGHSVGLRCWLVKQEGWPSKGVEERPALTWTLKETRACGSCASEKASSRVSGHPALIHL